mmetsp:Transcript_20568/g.30494  ORF Transcript_20568/g.30494 Transcript_20568/m.30494 type:complete len:143 (-) Transcript_20568:374-802(-)
MPRCVILDPSSGQTPMPMTTPLRKSLRPRRSTSKAASGFGGGYDSDSSFDPDEEQSNIYARGGGAPRSKQASLMGASVIPSATLSSTLPSQQQQQQQADSSAVPFAAKEGKGWCRTWQDDRMDSSCYAHKVQLCRDAEWGHV